MIELTTQSLSCVNVLLQANLKGQHQPLLHQLVISDLERLARWGVRYRDAMAAAAARQAAASGATMLAAAAGGSHISAAAAGMMSSPDISKAVAPATPGLAVQMGLHSTDELPTATAGTAAGGCNPLVVPQGGIAGTATIRIGTAGSKYAGGNAVNCTGSASSAAELAGSEVKAATAVCSGLPVDLLAAAVAAEMQDAAAIAAAVTDRRDMAWRLLRDASVVGSKECAVLLPAVSKYIGSDVGGQLKVQLETLQRLLSNMVRQVPDLFVVESVLYQCSCPVR
jgi:hypothetical protein